jgi:hypothetical protein
MLAAFLLLVQYSNSEGFVLDSPVTDIEDEGVGDIAGVVMFTRRSHK